MILKTSVLEEKHFLLVFMRVKRSNAQPRARENHLQVFFTNFTFPVILFANTHKILWKALEQFFWLNAQNKDYIFELKKECLLMLYWHIFVWIDANVLGYRCTKDHCSFPLQWPCLHLIHVYINLNISIKSTAHIFKAKLHFKPHFGQESLNHHLLNCYKLLPEWNERQWLWYRYW